MKKDKLYKVNKWNRPAFMPKGNLFAIGGPSMNTLFSAMNVASQAKSGGIPNFITSAFNGGNGIGSLFQSVPTTSTPTIGNGTTDIGKHNFGITPSSFEHVGNSKETPQEVTVKPSIGQALGMAASAIGSIPTGERRGMWDTLDPVHHLAGGRESGVGNALGDTGVALTQTGMQSGNPWMMAAGAGLKIVGGLTNAAFGIKTDQKKLEGVNAGIKANSNFVSNADSFDDVKGPEAVLTDTNVYQGGWFSGGKAARKNEDLKRQMVDARSWANRSVDNNIFNLQEDQLNDALANYSAYGGPLEMGMINNDNMGAIEYGFMSDYLDTKKRQTEQKNKMGNLFAGIPNSMFAFGGDMQTNYADFGTGLTHVDAGGQHETNPNDGVQMGIDPQGVPNLVEENETVYDDYVYSNRILADEATKKLFHLPKKKDITFADISKRLEKEIIDRPNDPISKAGFKAQMQALQEQQERQKQEMEAERARAAFEALSPEEQTAVMQQVAQQEAMTEQAAMQAQAGQMGEPSVAMTPEGAGAEQQLQADGSQAIVGQEPPVMAEGGHLFPWGGVKELFNVTPPYAASRTAGFIPYTRDLTEEEVLKREADPTFQAWTQYVNDNWDSDDVQAYLKDLDTVAGGNHLFDKEGKILPKAKEYFNHARTKNHKWGYYHLTPQQIAAAEAVAEATGVSPERVIGMSKIGQESPLEIAQKMDENGKATVISTPVPDDTTRGAGKSSEGKAQKAVIVDGETGRIVPDLKKETSFGMFGPLVNLGLMATGLGRPDYSTLDAATVGSGKAYTARFKPIGDYLTYRPMDIWFEQNRMDANARATDRAIMNNASPIGTRMAGLLANGYNSQLADGELYRKALEYNDAQREKVATFNRGTNQFNAEAYNRNSQFNAGALNEALGRSTNAKLHAAQQKLYSDGQWYNSLYGNINSMFDRINQWEKWKRDHNTLAKMYANGLAGVVDENTPVAMGYVKKASNGGKIKKGKKRGLTY